MPAHGRRIEGAISRVGRSFAAHVTLAAALFVSLVAGVGVPAPSQALASNSHPVKPVVYDEVLLLDVTQSMTGCCGGRNIWSKVQHSAEQLAGETHANTYFAIVPFDLGPRYREMYPHGVANGGNIPFQLVTSNAQRARAENFIGHLNPTGQFTYIYESLQYVLNQLARQRQSDTRHLHLQQVYLYTDGLDNSPQHRTFSDIVNLFHLDSTDNPYLTADYINLSTTNCPASFGATSGSGGGGSFTCISTPSGSAPPISQPILWSVSRANLGNFGPGGHATRNLTLRFNGNIPPGTRMGVSLAGDLALARGQASTVTMRPSVPLTVRPTSSSRGAHEGLLQLQAPVELSPGTTADVSYTWAAVPCGLGLVRTAGGCVARTCPAGTRLNRTSGRCITIPPVKPQSTSPVLIILLLLLALLILAALAYFIIDRTKPRFHPGAAIVVGGIPYMLRQLQGSGIRRPSTLPVGGLDSRRVDLPGVDAPAAYVRPYPSDAIQIRPTGTLPISKVGGEDITSWAPVYPTDRVQIGDQTITYEIQDQMADPFAPSQDYTTVST